MTRNEYTTQFPWIDPTKGYPDSTLIDGVGKIDRHIAVSIGSSHKSIGFMEPIHSDDLEHVDGLDWELFHASLEGTIDGVDYLWGMYVEGIGAFNIQVVKSHTRDLTDTERAAWSKKPLGMYGSHFGNLSYTLPSGVKP